MAGLWEGVPASPISAASSDQPPSKRNSYSPPSKLSMPPKRQLIADPTEVNQPWKRNRIDPTSSESNSLSGSGSIEFVEATTVGHSAVTGSALSAQDERRRALLLRLQAIDRMKKNLSQQSPRSADEDVLFVEDKTIEMPRVTSPSDVKTGPSTSAPILYPPKPRRTRTPQRKKPSRGKQSTAPVRQTQVIIVDDDSSTSSSVQRGKSTRAKKSVPPSRRATAAPTRASSRVRRPRTLEVGPTESNPDVRVPTPTCMSKCKRFQFCKKLTNAMLKDTAASFFAAPVKELWPEEAIPRYFDVISSPMDLRTVKRKLEFSAYISADKNGLLPYYFDVDRYSSDMRLIFRNAMVYNRVGDMLYNSAQSMLDDFDQKMRDGLPEPPTPQEVAKVNTKKRSVARKGRKERGRPVSSRADSENSALMSSDSNSVIAVASATAKAVRRSKPRAKQAMRKSDSDSSEPVPETKKELSERLSYLRRSRSAVLARTPMPKGSGYLSRAALLYNVAISHSQKRKCAEVITQNKVPSGKMVALLDMVRGAVTTGDEEDDDFELEFDKLDNQMWRNVEAFLEQYVPGFKTIRQSTLGREFTTVEQVDEEIEDLQRKLRKVAQTENESESDEEDVARTPKKSRSFFSEDAVDDSSSESESDSDGSDSSDSDSDGE